MRDTDDSITRPSAARSSPKTRCATGSQVHSAAQWGTSISKNPFLQFAVKGAKPGDRVAIAWADNRGNRRSDEATLAAAPA